MIPAGFMLQGTTYPNSFTLSGNLNIGLTNVIFTLPNGSFVPLTSTNAAIPSLGNLSMNGESVDLNYQFNLIEAILSLLGAFLAGR